MNVKSRKECILLATAHGYTDLNSPQGWKIWAARLDSTTTRSDIRTTIDIAIFDPSQAARRFIVTSRGENYRVHNRKPKHPKRGPD